MSSTLTFEQFVAMKLEYQAYLASQSATATPPTSEASTSAVAPKKGRNRTPEQKEKWNAYMREYKAKRKEAKKSMSEQWRDAARGSKASESSTSDSDDASS